MSLEGGGDQLEAALGVPASFCSSFPRWLLLHRVLTEQLPIQEGSAALAGLILLRKVCPQEISSSRILGGDAVTR